MHEASGQVPEVHGEGWRSVRYGALMILMLILIYFLIGAAFGARMVIELLWEGDGEQALTYGLFSLFLWPLQAAFLLIVLVNALTDSILERVFR